MITRSRFSNIVHACHNMCSRTAPPHVNFHVPEYAACRVAPRVLTKVAGVCAALRAVQGRAVGHPGQLAAAYKGIDGVPGVQPLLAACMCRIFPAPVVHFCKVCQHFGSPISALLSLYVSYLLPCAAQIACVYRSNAHPDWDSEARADRRHHITQAWVGCSCSQAGMLDSCLVCIL
jgi:hypothetical protein